MMYAELKGTAYTALRKKLIKEKGSPFQQEFLHILKDSSKFIEWIEAEVGIEDGDAFDLLSDQLTEHEFKDPPKPVEEELFGKWQDSITPAMACRSTFWGYVTLRHIQEGRIESFYLAGGLESIDKALKSGDASEMDKKAVRPAIRNLSGLPERGNRSVYVDCPLARAWWRCHIAEKVRQITSADSDKIMEVLRKRPSWAVLVDSVVSKNSVFGDEKIRAALIWALSERINDEKSSLFDGKTLGRSIKKIGVRLAWQELAVFEANQLKTLFEQEFLA